MSEEHLPPLPVAGVTRHGCGVLEPAPTLVDQAAFPVQLGERRVSLQRRYAGRRRVVLLRERLSIVPAATQDEVGDGCSGEGVHPLPVASPTCERERLLQQRHDLLASIKCIELDHEVVVCAERGEHEIVVERDLERTSKEDVRLVRAIDGIGHRLRQERVRQQRHVFRPLGDRERAFDAYERSVEVADEEVQSSKLGRQACAVTIERRLRPARRTPPLRGGLLPRCGRTTRVRERCLRRSEPTRANRRPPCRARGRA